jgi:hypothetical protein
MRGELHMAQHAELYGDDYYSWGRTGNPVTNKQKELITFIRERTGIRFEGSTSKEAYSFINKHYNKAKYSRRY